MAAAYPLLTLGYCLLRGYAVQDLLICLVGSRQARKIRARNGSSTGWMARMAPPATRDVYKRQG